MNAHEAKNRTSVKLGETGPQVFRLGLGCMGFSGAYGKTDPEEGVRTIQAAIDRGITLLDTGDFYGMGHNEMLVGRAIAGRRERVQLSVKFGALRGPDNSWLGIDMRPAAVKTFLTYSLQRLGVDSIDIYRPARLDPAVPIEETIGAIADLVKGGYVRHIGLSEVGVETIRRAHRVHPIVDLQIEYSVATRGPEEAIFPVLDELGISATLYGIFSRGLLTGSKPTDPTDYRAHLPRFTGESGQKNETAVAVFRRFAADHGMTPGQLAIAWVIARQPRLVPLIGAKTVAQVEDALVALDNPLSKERAAELSALVTVTGDRYPAAQMKMLDSERC
ncbi:MAG: aldo/keto reductase [Polyangiaceae bacterium]|nr:aldo/keto reductase [Polyangiaceae bacterium]